MKKLNYILPLLFLFAIKSVEAQQPADTSFLSYAKSQNALFNAALKAKDTAKYHSLLSMFLSRLNVLPPKVQQTYASARVNLYYNFSCLLSLTRSAGRSLNYLDSSIQAGLTDYAMITQDKDLDNIRGEKKYNQLVAPLRETGDYLYILKKDNDRYGKGDTITIPLFTYQPSTRPELAGLRATFKLDSIAGTGNEISRLINVLHWVHNTIPHDGQHESGIKTVNGFSIASGAKEKQIGVSCGELATVLNDCYLALGFAARKIYCQPKDSLKKDFDAHVINVVYSNSMKKWLWMDPTNDAYVMNEKGELLSIEEVRERLVNDKPLLVNPDANWNHRQSTEKENYLYQYMAKNLYRFYTPLESMFDVETRGGEKRVTYVHLAPAGYGKFKSLPSKREVYNKESATTFIYYTTHDPEVFWRKPE